MWHAARAHVYQQATENFGISVSQFHILRRIRGGIDSVSKLAANCHTLNPADRRNEQLSLSEEGQNLLNQQFSIW